MLIWLSYVAAILTTLSFVPQAIKTIRSQDTADLSLLTYVLFVIGTITWAIYGLGANETAVFLANSITSMFASVILYYKVRNTLREIKQKSQK